MLRHEDHRKYEVIFLLGSSVNNLQIDFQGLADGQTSCIMHAEIELVCLWCSVFLDLDGDVDLKVGHALDKTDRHFNVVNGRCSFILETSESSSWPIGLMSIVSQFSFDHDSLTWLSNDLTLR